MKLYYSKDINDTFQLAIPVVIGQLGHMMMGVVDSIMVGKVGAAPLAAASVSHGLFMIFMIFGIGVSMAISPLTAIERGAQKYSECGIVFRQGLLVNFAVGIGLSIIIFFGSYILQYLNQPDEIVIQGADYMKILAYSVIPVMIFQSYKQFSEGLTIMRPAMVITLLANIINAFVNWVLIYGNLGAPAMGLSGAGWATFSTRLLMAISIMVYVSNAHSYKPFEPNLHFRKINVIMIKKLLKLGVPGGLQYFFEVGAFAGSAIIIGWLGTNELAAHQIAINLASISFMFALGISAAGSIRVGNAVGRDDRRATRNAGLAAFILSAIVMGTFAIVFFLFRTVLPTLYIKNMEVIEIASSLLIITAFFQLSDGTQAVGIGVLRGIADAKIPMIITFLAYWIVGLPVGYLLGFSFHLGVQGVWLGLLLALTASAVMLSYRFISRSLHKVTI